MQTVHADLIKGKKVLLRYDIDVPIQNGIVVDDFRLEAGLPTLKLCLENASQVIILGHVGRPEGEDKKFSVAPIYEWFKVHGYRPYFESNKLKLLENLRFELGEDGCDPDYAKELASLGDVYINEAFAAYHKASSTTILPTLLPHAAGLHFAEEVEKLRRLRENPQKPFLALIAGAKIGDKLEVIQVLAERANAVLVGGKLASQVHEDSFNFPHNVMAAHLTPDSLDISQHTIETWRPLLTHAAEIVWNGPVGKVESDGNSLPKSSKGTAEIAKILLGSKAEIIIGGGDTVGFLDKAGFLKRFQEKDSFISAGGGAMLEFLTKGTLDTIEVLV